jgi:hypothetical protein
LAKNGIQLTMNWEPFLDVISGLRPPKLDRPVALALVDTAKAANSKAASQIAKHTGLKVAQIKPRLFYDRVNIGQYQTFVRSSRKLWPIIDFNAAQTGVGVRASKPWGKAQVFKSAFISQMGGHRGVYRRVQGAGRLPVKELWGPSVHSTFKQPAVVKVIQATVATRLPILLARRIKAEMRRANR